MGVRGRCKITPPRFLAECRKRRLNQGSFVSAVCLVVYFLWFVLCLYVYFCNCGLYSVFSLLYVCQYQPSDWLWRPPPKWPILCHVGVTLYSIQPDCLMFVASLLYRSVLSRCVCLYIWYMLQCRLVPFINAILFYYVWCSIYFMFHDCGQCNLIIVEFWFM